MCCLLVEDATGHQVQGILGPCIIIDGVTRISTTLQRQKQDKQQLLAAVQSSTL